MKRNSSFCRSHSKDKEIKRTFAQFGDYIKKETLADEKMGCEWKRGVSEAKSSKIDLIVAKSKQLS